jgi:putative hydrolase of the HAD superfamily
MDLVIDVRDHSTKNTDLLNYIIELKKHYQTGVISNTGRSMFERLFSNDEISEYFDTVVLSYKEKIAKPDTRIYQIAAKRLGVRPEECIFVDDKQVYLDAAEKVGMKGVLFDDTEKAIRKIEEILNVQLKKDAK